MEEIPDKACNSEVLPVTHDLHDRSATGHSFNNLWTPPEQNCRIFWCRNKNEMSGSAENSDYKRQMKTCLSHWNVPTVHRSSVSEEAQRIHSENTTQCWIYKRATHSPDVFLVRRIRSPLQKSLYPHVNSPVDVHTCVVLKVSSFITFTVNISRLCCVCKGCS